METQKPKPDEYEYEILTGDGSRNGEELREFYISNTKRLIMLGINVVKPDYVLFLDKSARPVSWMVKELWDDFSDTKEMPEFKYLNIDRNHWRDNSRDATELIDRKELSVNRIHELHALFATENIKETPLGSGKVSPSVMEVPTIFDDKKVLVVDEVKATGDTLRIAESILREAFPKAEVAGRHWLSPETVPSTGGTTINKELPVWYKEKDTTGRGVGQRDSILSLRPKEHKGKSYSSKNQRIGRYFLSRAMEKSDTRSQPLRDDIKHMAAEYHSKKTS